MNSPNKDHAIDVQKIRKDFPILKRKVYGKRLIYLDNAATSQKPKQVMAAMDQFYMEYNANVHRSIHKLGEEATLAYEGARDKVAKFINAESRDGVVFTRNTTESINLIAYSWGRAHVNPGDRILLSIMEHHSNLVPWQLLAQEKSAVLDFVNVTDDGLLNMGEFESFLTERTKLVALSHVSNVVGTINPVKEMVRVAGKVGAVTVVDAAQSVPHMPVDVQELGCDFFAFSGHKMLGPTGIGVLQARTSLLDEMEPFLSGGEMISEVDLKSSTWNELPWKFEAGTMNIAEAIGLGAAVDYLSSLGMENVREHERVLTKYALEELEAINELEIYGPKDAGKQGGLIAFNYSGIHPHDLASILDREGIAIRSGHQCAQPFHRRFKMTASGRASFYIYNDETDIDNLVTGLKKVGKVLAR